jgi:hypothetical protein
MQAVVVAADSHHVGQTCKLCTRQIKARQAILVDTVAEIRFGTGRTRRYHTKCMRQLVDDAPKGVDELDELRDLIAATGNPYA